MMMTIMMITGNNNNGYCVIRSSASDTRVASASANMWKIKECIRVSLLSMEHEEGTISQQPANLCFTPRHPCLPIDYNIVT